MAFSGAERTRLGHTATTTQPVGSFAGRARSPTVDAGGPYSGLFGVGTLLTATVTAGTDPAPTNKWTIQSGGAGTFNDDTLEDPIFTPGTAGGYVLLLTVSSTDSADVTDTATFTATEQVKGGGAGREKRKKGKYPKEGYLHHFQEEPRKPETPPEPRKEEPSVEYEEVAESVEAAARQAVAGAKQEAKFPFTPPTAVQLVEEFSDDDEAMAVLMLDLEQRIGIVKKFLKR